MWALTGPSGQTELLYRWAVQLESTRTHRPPGPRSHLGPVSAAAYTEGQKNKTQLSNKYNSKHWFLKGGAWDLPSPEWCCACVGWGDQCELRATWPEPCTHSSALRCPHHRPEQTDSERKVMRESEWMSKKGRLSGNRHGKKIYFKSYIPVLCLNWRFL